MSYLSSCARPSAPEVGLNFSCAPRLPAVLPCWADAKWAAFAPLAWHVMHDMRAVHF